MSEIRGISPLDRLRRDGARVRRAEGAPLSVVLAAGPFSVADSLAFEPLEELLAVAAAGRAPDALVLLGPFVDVEQPALADGSLTVTFEQLFSMQASWA